MLGCSLLVFMPIAFASLAFDLGIIGVWAGRVALILGRAVTLGVRFSGGRWAVTGARAIAFRA
jgi:MATE family, multidrug efflux pump